MVNFHRAATMAACIALLVSGCGFLRSGTAVAPHELVVSSDAFSQFSQKVLPRDYTCRAAHPITPPITWSGAPSATQGYALVVDDASAPITPYIYWLVVGIQPGTTDIQENMLPSGARAGLNSAGIAGYTPPCPHGSPHNYRFTVYALSQQLDLPANATMQETWRAIADATIGRGRVEVTANL